MGSSFPSSQGAGPIDSKLERVGPGNTTAITVRRNKYYQFSDFSIENGTSVNDNITAIACTGTTSGTQTGGSVWANVAVSHFTTGVQIGDTSTGAASEMTFVNLQLAHNDVGLVSLEPDAGRDISTGWGDDSW